MHPLKMVSVVAQEVEDIKDREHYDEWNQWDCPGRIPGTMENQGA